MYVLPFFLSRKTLTIQAGDLVGVIYGFLVRNFSESDCVARLFQLYAELNASKGGK